MTLRKSVTLYFMSAVPTILGNLFATSPNFAKFAFCSHNMSQRLWELEHCKTIDDMFHNLVDGFRMLSQAGELSCVSMPQLPVCYDRMFASSISLFLSALLFIICHSILYIVFHSCLLYWHQVHFIHIYLMRSISVHLTLSCCLIVPCFLHSIFNSNDSRHHVISCLSPNAGVPPMSTHYHPGHLRSFWPNISTGKATSASLKKGGLHMSGIWMQVEQRPAKAKGLKSCSPCDFRRRPSSKGNGNPNYITR